MYEDLINHLREDWCGHREEAALAIEDLSNRVNAEANWIPVQIDRWIYSRCSSCNTTWDAQSNYCPYCGKKMNWFSQE